MTSPIEPRTASLYHAARAAAVEPAAAAAIAAAATATYLAIVALVSPPLSFVVAQLALVAIAAAGVAIARPPHALAALGVRAARLRYFVAAIAIGASAWYVNAWLVKRLIERVALPDDQIHRLERLVDRPDALRAFAVFAVLPAVCEELVFRGVLARALARRGAVISAAGISALVFSVYHLSPVQALPTFTLGVVLAVLAIRADSVLPAMLAHATNNAIAIAMSRGELAVAASWLVDHPIAALIGCASATGIGVAIALKGPS